MLRLVLLASGGAAMLAVLGFLAWDRFAADRSDHAIDRRLALGQALYDEHCASCHGRQLEGQPNWRERQSNGRLPAPPHDDSGHTWHHPDDVLFGITRQGLAPYAPPGYASDMPAFGEKLTDDEIRSVLAYIKSTWSPEIRARQEAITKQAMKGGR